MYQHENFQWRYSHPNTWWRWTSCIMEDLSWLTLHVVHGVLFKQLSFLYLCSNAHWLQPLPFAMELLLTYHRLSMINQDMPACLQDVSVKIEKEPKQSPHWIIKLYRLSRPLLCFSYSTMLRKQTLRLYLFDLQYNCVLIFYPQLFVSIIHIQFFDVMTLMILVFMNTLLSGSTFFFSIHALQ